MEARAKRSFVSRRSLLSTGAKLAYVTPAVVVALRLDSSFASASGGPPNNPPPNNPPGNPPVVPNSPPGVPINNPNPIPPPSQNNNVPPVSNVAGVGAVPNTGAAAPASSAPTAPPVAVEALQPTPTEVSPAQSTPPPPVGGVSQQVVGAPPPGGRGPGVQPGASAPMPSTEPHMPNTGTGGLAAEEERR